MIRTIGVCLFLIFITLTAYWQVQGHAFVDYDDPGYVSQNNHVRQGITRDSIQWAFTSGDMANWHPLTWLSHMIDCHLFGTDQPGFHHLTSLLLHVLNTLLVFALLKQMARAFWRSAIVAAIFALHPVHVESVAWVAERKDVLSTMFWLMHMMVYVQYTRCFDSLWQASSRKPVASLMVLAWYLLSFIFLGLGLLSKPMLVTAPCLLLLLDYWPLDRLVRDRFETIATKAARVFHTSTRVTVVTVNILWIIVEKLLMFVLIAISCVVTFLVQKEGGALENYPLWHRLATAATAYVRYVGKIFWPMNLSPFYPNHVGMWQRWQVLGAVMLLLLITALVVILHRKRYLVVGWLWYLGTLVPIIGIVAVGAQSMADRYVYMPMIGVLIMIVWGIVDLCMRWAAGQLVAGATVVVAITVCLWLTLAQVAKWQDSVTLFNHAIEVTRDNNTMHVNLGVALLNQDRVEEALYHYRQALRIKRDYAEAHYNLGNALLKEGQLAEAVRHLGEAARLKPDTAEPHLYLAIALKAQGHLNESIRHFQQAIRIDPGQALAHENLGVTLKAMGRLDEAIDHLREAVRINPNFSRAHNNLGTALIQVGQPNEAIRHFQQAIRINPNYVFAHYNLAILLESGGDLDTAAQYLREVIRLNPSHEAGQRSLARIESRLKQRDSSGGGG